LRWVLESVDQDDTGPARTARAPITDFTAYEREQRHTYALRYKGEIGAGVLSADLSKGQAKASTTRSFPTIETIDYDQTELNVRYALEWDAHTMVVGGGWRKDDLAVSIVPTVANTDNKHLLIQDEWRVAPD
jgi:outer membrane receptor for ferrienterochelin and colicin